MTTPTNEPTLCKINQETSKIAWKELQRFFAGGKALGVSTELDLVEAAFQMSADNAGQIAQWVQAGLLAKVSDDQARQWLLDDALVWAVVVSPWVLVQPLA